MLSGNLFYCFYQAWSCCSQAYGLLSQYAEWRTEGQQVLVCVYVCVSQHTVPLQRSPHPSALLLPSLQQINTDNGEWFKFPSPQCHSPVCRGPTASVPCRYTSLPHTVIQRSWAALQCQSRVLLSSSSTRQTLLLIRIWSHSAAKDGKIIIKSVIRNWGEGYVWRSNLWLILI